ncbi:hypothetical protein ACWV95_20060 [Streptomyces albus]
MPALSAVLGAIAALLALPSVPTVVAVLVTSVIAVLVIPLALLDAGPTSSAAVVAVVMLLLFRVLPRIASQIAVLVPGEPQERRGRESDEVAAAVRCGNRLLTFLTVLLAVGLGWALVTLAASDDPYAFGLLGCAGVAVLLEAGSSRLVPVVAPQLAVGTLGLVPSSSGCRRSCSTPCSWAPWWRSRSVSCSPVAASGWRSAPPSARWT